MDNLNSPNAGEQLKKNWLALLILGVLLISLLTFGNYRYARVAPGGTDFLYRWLPVRLILFEGYQNPYSPEVEYQVELIHHGHAHQGDETPGIFAYPYYIIPLYIPFALIENFNFARAIWMTVLELSQTIIVLLTLGLIGYKPGKFTLFLMLLFSLASSFLTQPLIDGNPSSITTLFIILCLIAIKANKDWTAGVLLALSTIKPQLALLFFLLVWIWAFSHKRWKIIQGSVVLLLFMLGVSFAIQPSWFAEFVKDVLLYPQVASPHSPFSILDQWFPTISTWIAIVITILVLLILGREWVRVYKKPFGTLFWVSCLTFILLPLSGISSAKSNFVAWIPAFVLIVYALDDLLGKRKYVLNILLIISIILSWVLNYVGRQVYIGEYRLYFVDFLIIPLIFTYGIFWARKYFQKNRYLEDSSFGQVIQEI